MLRAGLGGGGPAGGGDAASRARAAASELDARLALLFAVEAARAVLGRLETLSLELELRRCAPLRALRDAPAWDALRRAAPARRRWRRPAVPLPPRTAKSGRCALDEPHAMAQERSAASPRTWWRRMAETIHRQNLTVPESLLQPMREMGVFGLSIPERFGGSAPDDRDDTLMMVLVTEALSEARWRRPAA